MKDDFKPYLPGVLALIAEEISEDLAVRLAQQRGGRPVYISKDPKADDSLVELVGLEDARKLHALLGHGSFIVPMGNFGGEQARRARIAQLLGTGMSHANIAAEVDAHVRTVERVAKELRDARQSDLFL